MAEIIKLDGSRPLDFDREMVEQAYDRWAPVYDLVFGGVFSKGRKAAIAAFGSSAPTFRRRCCKRPGSASRSSA